MKSIWHITILLAITATLALSIVVTNNQSKASKPYRTQTIVDQNYLVSSSVVSAVIEQSGVARITEVFKGTKDLMGKSIKLQRQLLASSDVRKGTNKALDTVDNQNSVKIPPFGTDIIGWEFIFYNIKTNENGELYTLVNTPKPSTEFFIKLASKIDLSKTEKMRAHIGDGALVFKGKLVKATHSINDTTDIWGRENLIVSELNFIVSDIIKDISSPQFSHPKYELFTNLSRFKKNKIPLKVKTEQCNTFFKVGDEYIITAQPGGFTENNTDTPDLWMNLTCKDYNIRYANEKERLRNFQKLIQH